MVQKLLTEKDAGSASGSIFQESRFLAKHCNTFHAATYVVAPQHEALAAFLASNWWTTLENQETFVPLLNQTDSKIQTAVGGILFWWVFFFSEQWHLPFRVAFKVVSILCSRFWIFLCLFPAAPTLDGTFAIVLALICTEVSSPAGRAEVPPSLGGLTTLLSRVGDIFCTAVLGMDGCS